MTSDVAPQEKGTWIFTLAGLHPDDVPALTALDETGDLARGIVLKNLANAGIAGDEKHIRGLCSPRRGLAATARANELSVHQLKRKPRFGILELVRTHILRKPARGQRDSRWIGPLGQRLRRDQFPTSLAPLPGGTGQIFGVDGLGEIMLRFVLTKQGDRYAAFLVIRQQFNLDGATQSLR